MFYRAFKEHLFWTFAISNLFLSPLTLFQINGQFLLYAHQCILVGKPGTKESERKHESTWRSGTDMAFWKAIQPVSGLSARLVFVRSIGSGWVSGRRRVPEAGTESTSATRRYNVTCLLCGAHN